MSVVSSRANSVSSILKTEIRTQLHSTNNVHFQLPTNIQYILSNFQNGIGIKEYQNLIQLLQEGKLKDNNLTEFIYNLKQYVAYLNIDYKLFIEALLKINWLDKSPEVISAYKVFLQDLICVQNCYINTVINHLLQFLKLDGDNNIKCEADISKNENIEKLNHVHDVLHKILELIPMSNGYILESLELQFPHLNSIHDNYTHQIYIYSLLKIMQYAPKQRSDILFLIISKLMILDVNIPYEKLNEEEEMEEENEENSDKNDNDSSKVNNDNTETDTDNTNKTINPIAGTLDTCMELVFKYIHEFCFENDVLQTNSLRILYDAILRIFENVILTTHISRYVQYIGLYICSFKPIVADMFINWLWHKVNNPNASSILRQSAVCYISSLCANASFINSGLVMQTLSKLVNWLHDYIAKYECLDVDMKTHIVFYSVCQAFFHLFNARHQEFVLTKNMFLQQFNISTIINSKLNPLKLCNSQIVYNFAEITSKYQIAYCYTVIENNERDRLPIFGKSSNLTLLSNFFPFESYTLQHSGQRIVPLLRYNLTDMNQCILINK